MEVVTEPLEWQDFPEPTFYYEAWSLGLEWLLSELYCCADFLDLRPALVVLLLSSLPSIEFLGSPRPLIFWISG